MMPMSFSRPVVPVSASGSLVSSAASLPLVGMRIVADACNGLARVVVEQRFHNPHPTPLAVTYLFPLPADAAVSGFSFVIGDRRIQGEIAGRAEARERFEEALVLGKGAALLEQQRTSLFTQEIANIPPGAEVVAELVIDQPLRWLDEGAWEWRFPTAAAPRYLAAPGEVVDAARVEIDVAAGPLTARVGLDLSVRDPFKDGTRIESPSHALAVSARSEHPSVGFVEERGEPLDRDVVVRWRVVGQAPGFTVDLGRAAAASATGHDAFALCTLVPPAPSPTTRAVPRDLIVLLDTSGSMGGEPLAQARRVVAVLIDALSDRDQLELLEFSTEARRWKRGAVSATAANRQDAITWLAALRAGGGTEMRTGITEAMATLREGSLRQIVLVTDGQIGFESQVIAELSQRLPRGTRLHTVGVGSAVNRSLTGPAARVGRGVEVIVGLGEDAERAASRLVARTAAPLVVDVTLEGSALLEHAPARLADLYAGAPLLVSAKVRAGGGDLTVRGRTVDGPWEAKVVLPAMAPATGNRAVVTLFGREKVEDLEAAYGAGADPAFDRQVETIGLAFGIATRLTSWVAVSDVALVDPRDPTRRERIPQALPHGMSIERLGLRRPQATTGGVLRAAKGSALPLSPAPAGAMPLMRGGMGAPPRPSRAAAPPSSVAGRFPGAPPPPAAPKRTRRAALDELRALEPSAEDFVGAADGADVTVLTGRLVSSKNGISIFEIAAGPAGLAWTPEAMLDLTVTDPSGQELAVPIDLAWTTRASVLAAGDLARLAVGFSGAAVSLSFDILGRRFVVTLAA